MYYFKAWKADVFAHAVCDGSKEPKMEGIYFYLGACTQGKNICLPS